LTNLPPPSPGNFQGGFFWNLSSRIFPLFSPHKRLQMSHAVLNGVIRGNATILIIRGGKKDSDWIVDRNQKWFCEELSMPPEKIHLTTAVGRDLRNHLGINFGSKTFFIHCLPFFSVFYFHTKKICSSCFLKLSNHSHVQYFPLFSAALLPHTACLGFIHHPAGSAAVERPAP